MRPILLVAACLLALVAAPARAADELPVYKLDVRDGVFEPATIEFESRDLRQEKVLAPGAKSSVVINPLKPGTYTFFDEYHMDLPKGKIVAK